MTSQKSPLPAPPGKLVLRLAWAPLAVVVAHAVGAELFGHGPALDAAMRDRLLAPRFPAGRLALE